MKKNKKEDSEAIWKPTQKLMRLSPERISVHDSARTAYQVWQQLRTDAVAINYSTLIGYYQQPVRLIETRHKTSGRYHYLFFERFDDIHRIQMVQSQQRQPSYIYQDNKKAVQTLAWSEVLKLANQKNTHHPSLFKCIRDNAPRAIILGLMQKKRFSVESYCDFAKISRDSYESQQRRKDGSNPHNILDNNMDWLGLDA